MEIVLWPLTPEDVPAFAKMCNDMDRSYLTDAFPHPYTEEVAQWWIDQCARQEGKQGMYRAVFRDGVMVGNVGVNCKQDVFSKDAMLGYSFKTEVWSQGIATQAVRQMCGLAFANLGLLRITAQVFEPNRASCRVLEKNGFVLEGIQKKAVYKNGQVWDLILYAKYRD